MPNSASRGLKRTMFFTDLGFFSYWVLVSIGVISVGKEGTLLDWNWSFFGLDMLAIFIGLGSLIAARRGSPLATQLIVISLTLTSAAGLMAVSFYLIRFEFDPAWWIPNLWLLLFPIVGLVSLLRPRKSPIKPVPSRPETATSGPDLLSLEQSGDKRRSPWAICSLD
jgi:hypothetical protein